MAFSTSPTDFKDGGFELSQSSPGSRGSVLGRSHATKAIEPAIDRCQKFFDSRISANRKPSKRYGEVGQSVALLKTVAFKDDGVVVVKGFGEVDRVPQVTDESLKGSDGVFEDV